MESIAIAVAVVLAAITIYLALRLRTVSIERDLSQDGHRQDVAALNRKVELLAEYEGDMYGVLMRGAAQKLSAAEVLGHVDALFYGGEGEANAALYTLRQKLDARKPEELGPVARAEVERITRLIEDARRNNWGAVCFAEMSYGKDDRLGQVVQIDDDIPFLHSDRRRVRLVGPIEQINAYFKREGIALSFPTELRYVNHPKGGGVVTLCLAHI